MRLSEKPRVAGLVIGVVVGAASWAGNAARTNLGLVTAFPDLLTVAAVPLAMYFFVRARARVAHPPDLRSLRRLGWSVVNTAAIVLAVFLASVAGFWFNQLDGAFVTSTLVGAVVVTVGLGYASVEVWARLLLGVHGGEHR
jgi:Na+/H+-dicarboxylate symporter